MENDFYSFDVVKGINFKKYFSRRYFMSGLRQFDTITLVSPFNSQRIDVIYFDYGNFIIFHNFKRLCNCDCYQIYDVIITLINNLNLCSLLHLEQYKKVNNLLTTDKLSYSLLRKELIQYEC